MRNETASDPSRAFLFPFHPIVALVLGMLATFVGAAEQRAATEPIVVTGSVPDEATRVALIAKVRETFGRERVVDNLSVGGVVAPPNWTTYAVAVVTPDLKGISHGQMTLDGTNLTISGQVPSEAARQGIVGNLANNLTPTHVVKNGLQVAAPTPNLLERVLAGRTVEFETGSTRLTPYGMLVVDEIAAAMKALGPRNFQVIGHTDNLGSRNPNIALSLARANAVRNYLGSKGIDPGRITTRGDGPDNPVAANNTEAGRARNRRIEFKVD